MLLKHADFDVLREAVLRAARNTFLKAKAAHADETFFAFVLTTYGTGSLGGCSANTIENHCRIWDRARTHADARPQDEHYYKWYCGEWGDYEFIGEQSLSFLEPSRLYHQALETLRGLLRDQRRDESEAWGCCEDYPLHEALFEALHQLDVEGVFGVGDARHNTLVYMTEYDGRDEVERWSIERLNPDAPPHLKQEATSWLTEARSP